IRRSVEESPAFEEMQELQKDSTAPLAVLFKNHWATVLKCALIFAANNAIGYFAIAYFISYGTKYVGYERTDALAVALAGAAAWLVSTLYFGKLSDRVGRKRTFFIGYLLLAAWSVPMWLLIDTGNLAMLYVAVIVLGFCLFPSYVPYCASFAELFSVKVRLSGVFIGYAIGSIVAGAFAPMLAEILFTTYIRSRANASYCVVITIVSLIGIAL